MRFNRRQSLGLGALGLAGALSWRRLALGKRNKEQAPATADPAPAPLKRRTGKPMVISTWQHGIPANEAAMSVLAGSGSALDAVETGVRVSESDPECTSVGLGGMPNADGVVQLDAAIMDGPTARSGCVACLEGIENPIRVARRVMEETRHVLLVGQDAKRFALEQGYEERDLLTDKARQKWEEWKAEQSSQQQGTEHDHDTIAMCALDASGHMATACTTSGLAWKIPGRVGDSPIPGAGAFVDEEVGAAGSTGVGEEVLQTCGSFLVVENMRRGMDPTAACADAVDRILHKHPQAAVHQVAYLALRMDGVVGAFAIREGFQYAVHDGENNTLIDAPFRIQDKG